MMMDFEQALRSSLSSTFPSALVDGCHFHFCQAVLRNLYSLGYKTEYKTVTTNPVTGFKEHSLVYTWVRRLMMQQLLLLQQDHLQLSLSSAVGAVLNGGKDHFLPPRKTASCQKEEMGWKGCCYEEDRRPHHWQFM